MKASEHYGAAKIERMRRRIRRKIEATYESRGSLEADLRTVLQNMAGHTAEDVLESLITRTSHSGGFTFDRLVGSTAVIFTAGFIVAYHLWQENPEALEAFARAQLAHAEEDETVREAHKYEPLTGEQLALDLLLARDGLTFVNERRERDLKTAEALLRKVLGEQP